MFAKINPWISSTRNLSLVFKRNYNMKKLSLIAQRNPHLSDIVEEKLKKREQKGILNKLVNKRTTEYKEYFSQSSEPSVIKRVKHKSYDHIGQKRAIHLSKILRAFLTDRIGSGEIGEILSTKNFQLTNIVVPVDLNRIEIHWWSPEEQTSTVEELLKSASEELKTAIRHARLLPNLPPVIFKRDTLRTERDHINHLIDTADKGITDETCVQSSSNERDDLYDSDRTIILRKLSLDEKNDEEVPETSQTKELSNEEFQRRMKAFALTKKMKRVQESRNAMYGIMAIEKERENREHFSLNSREEKINYEEN